MKKFFLTFAVIAASLTSTFAVTSEKTEVFYNLNNEKVFNGLTKYLDTDNEQAEILKMIFESTEMKMKRAEKKNDEKAYEKAVIFNLGNARHLLTRAQYRKYLALLNLTLASKDFEAYTASK